MSGRSPYPKLVTTNTALGGNRGSNIASPADDGRRASTSASSDQMHPRKRATGPSRANSPPEKRMRSGDYNRPSKDTRRESLDRRVSNGVQGPNDAGQSPLLRTHSPLSVLHGDVGTPGSGASTPQHVAPPAPSMVATTPSSGAAPNAAKFNYQAVAAFVNLAKAEYHDFRLNEQEKLEGSVSGTVASLRLIRARKQAQAAAELESCKQRIGNHTSQMLLRAAVADKYGADGLSNEERPVPNRLEAENKALQIEIGNIRNEEKLTRSRLDELEKLNNSREDKLNSLRQDMDALLNRITPLVIDPEQLKKQGALCNSIGKLQGSVAELTQWKESQAEPLTLQQVQRAITERSEPALKDLRTDIAMLKQVSKDGPTSGSLLQDVRMLVNFKNQMEDFKKQTEKADWPKQLNATEKRIDVVNQNEKETHDMVKRLKQRQEDDYRQIKDLVRRHELEMERTTEELEGIESELMTVNGPLKAEYERTGKSALDRIQDLEKANGQISAFQGKQDRFSNDLLKMRKDLEDKLTTLSAAASGTLSRKEVNDRIDTLHTALKELRAVSGAEAVEGLNNRINTLNTSLEGLRAATGAKMSDLEARMAATEQLLFPLRNDVRANNAQTAVHKSKMAELESRLESFLSHVSLRNPDGDDHRAAKANPWEEEFQTISENISALDTRLMDTENGVHELKITTTTVVKDVVEKFATMLQESESRIWVEMQLINDKLEQQHQVTPPQPPLMPAVQQQIDALAQKSQTLTQSNMAIQNSMQIWQHTMEGKFNECTEPIANLRQDIEILQTASRSLEDRYQNISTDKIYQHMVHWFQQSYPNAHGLVHQLNSVQQEVVSLKEFENKSSWLNQYKNQLFQLFQLAQQLAEVAKHSQQFMHIAQNSAGLQNLVQHSQQLMHIAQNGADLRDLPQLRQMLDNTSDIAHDALAKSNEAATQVKNHTDSITNLSNQISQQRDSITALTKKADTEHDDWTQSVNNLAVSVDTVGSNLSAQGKRIDRLDQSATNSVKQLGEVKNSVSSIENSLDLEQIGRFSAFLPQIMAVLYQVYKAVLAIDEGPLRISFDVEEMMKALCQRKRSSSQGQG